jgi:hypothetical protein
LSAAVNGIEAFPVEVEVNSGWGDTTITLAPADVKKEGLSFNLPMAIGMLAANDQIQARFEICPPFCHAPSQCQRFLRRTDTILVNE